MNVPTPPEGGSSGDWKHVAKSAAWFTLFVGFAMAQIHGSKFLSKEFIGRPVLYQAGGRGLLESIPLVGIVFERTGWGSVASGSTSSTATDDGFNG